MTEFKVSNGVLAEFTAATKDGEKYVIATVTVAFCDSLGQAHSEAAKLKSQWDNSPGSESSVRIRMLCDAVMAANPNAEIKRVTVEFAATFVRISERARPVW